MEPERGGRPRYLGILTPAEQRVLEELRRGGTNVEIAVRLGLSPETVKTHIASMLSKLDLDNRQQLARWLPREESTRRRVLGALGVPAGLATLKPLVWVGAGLLGIAAITVAAGFVAAMLTDGGEPIAVAPGDSPAAVAKPSPAAATTPPPAATTDPSPAAAAATPSPAAAATPPPTPNPQPTPTPTATSTPTPTPAVTPEVLPAIEELDWVRDGLTDEESWAVEDLQSLARSSPQAFSDVMGKEWITGDFTIAKRLTISVLENIATDRGPDQPEIAPVITNMRFLDSFEYRDLDVVSAMSLILGKGGHNALGFIRDIAAQEDQDDLTAYDIMTFYFKSRDVYVNEAVQELEWLEQAAVVRDTANFHSLRTFREHQHFRNLFVIYLESPETFLELLGKEWIRRPPGKWVFTGISRLVILVQHDADLGQIVVEMPFLQTWEEFDALALEFLEDLAGQDPEGLRTLVLHYQALGGLTDEQVGTIKATYLQLQNSETGAAFVSLPWVRDGVDESEKQAALVLQRLALEAEPVFLNIVARGWVRDGLNADELWAVGSFWGMAATTLAGSDQAAALRISNMPFMEDVDGLTAAAVQALMGLTWSGHLQWLLDHPRFAGGITDHDAVLVAILDAVAGKGEGLLAELLESDAVQIHFRTLTLQYTSEVKISALHLGQGNYRTIDIIEEVVRSQEAFMLTPFPRSYLGVFVLDLTAARGGGGASGIVTIDPGYEESRLLIAHEVAHTYWPFFPPWIAEGAAEFMTSDLEGRQPLEGPQPTGGCPLADTLGELDALFLQRLDAGLPTSEIYYDSACAYTLGRDLFAGLYDTLGDEAFRQGFRRLYLAMKDETHTAVCSGVERGVCYVKRAFVTDASPKAAELAEPVINRLYYGSPDGPASDP